MDEPKGTTVEPVVSQEATKDVKVTPEASSASAPATQPNGAVESAAGRLPFGKDPEIAKYIERQVARREGLFTRELQELKDSYLNKMEEFASRTSSPTQPASQVTAEQDNALNQLADMLFNHPKIREKYGLDEINRLKEQFSSKASEETSSAYEGEMASVVDQYTDKYGYEKEDLREQLEDFIAQDPWLAGKNYNKGAIAKIAKLFFSDKSQELADRASNLKLIKEQKEKKAAATETTSSGTKGKEGVKDKTLESYLDRRVSEEGGLKFD